MIEYDQIALDKMADQKHEIYALLKQRYSPRVFDEEPISKKDMNQLFEAARWSASCNNWQPWRFVYGFKGEEGYNKIYDCLDEFNQSWADNAPVLMLTAYKEKTPDGKDNFHALHDLGLAMGSMTMQAQYKSIAVHHMAGFDWEKAKEVFTVPQGYHFATAVAIGRFGGDLEKLPEDLQRQEKSERERMPQEDFAFENHWKTKQ